MSQSSNSRNEKVLKNYISCMQLCSDETQSREERIYGECVSRCSRLYKYETECPMFRYHQFKRKLAEEYHKFFDPDN